MIRIILFLLSLVTTMTSCSISVMRIPMYMYNYSYNIIIIDLLDRIAADLRSVVPPTAIAPDEAQHYPTVGQVHVGKRESISVCIYKCT